MPDQSEVMEYKKKISTLSLPDLKDILAHINRDKVPWKYDMVNAEIEAKESGKAAPEPVIKEEPKAESKKEVPEAKEGPASGPAAVEQPKKPAFQLRKSRVGGAVPEQRVTPTPTPVPPPPPEPPPVPKKEEIAPPKAAGPVEVKAAPEPPTPAEARPQVEPVKAAQQPAPTPQAPAKEKAAGLPVDYALLGLSIVFILLAVYIVAVPFVNLPGGEAMKSLLNKIPLF
jgi:hypothetical protein